MTRPTAQTVPIALDKPRSLKLTLNAMIKIEKRIGRQLAQLGEPSMEEVLVLLWACLLHEDKDLTPEAVGDMVHAGNLSEVMEAFGSLMDGMKPKGGKGTANPPKSRPVG